MHARPILVPTLLALLLAACGDAPQKIDAPAPAAHSADDGHDHSTHATTSAETPTFSGVIVLKGPRAESDTGVLMVSLVSRGQRMPRMSYRLPLSGQPPAVDGERRIPFRLDQGTDMLKSGLPAELQGTPLDLSVRFDQDGMVETREGDVTVAVPVGWGAEGLEIPIGG
jgi:hypothetical protein